MAADLPSHNGYFSADAPLIKLLLYVAEELKRRAPNVRDESERDLRGIGNVLLVLRDLGFYTLGAVAFTSTDYWKEVEAHFAAFNFEMRKLLYRVRYVLCSDDERAAGELDELVETFLKEEFLAVDPTNGPDHRHLREFVMQFTLRECRLLSGADLPDKNQLTKRFHNAATALESASTKFAEMAESLVSAGRA